MVPSKKKEALYLSSNFLQTNISVSHLTSKTLKVVKKL